MTGPQSSTKERLVAAWDALAGIDPADVDSVVYLELREAQDALERAIRKQKAQEAL